MSERPLEDPPEPLVPANVDLRCYEYMPLYGDVLFTSNLHARATPLELKHWLRLCWASWWQVPAASVPNDELQLAQLAGCKTTRTWRKVRDRVMAKWVLCSDNRWYHPFLATQAVVAYSKRRSAQTRGALGAQVRKQNKSNQGRPRSSANSSANPTPIAQLIAEPQLSTSLANSNRSERNTPQPPARTSTSTPKAAAHSIANAERVIAEGQQRRETQAPPPGGSVAAFIQAATQHLAPAREEDTPDQQSSNPEGGPDHGEGNETLDS